METRQSTHPSPQQLAALALGKLAPDAHDRLQAHLSTCASCKAFLAETPRESLVSLLQQSAVPRARAEQATPASQQQRTTNPGLAKPQSKLPQAQPLPAKPQQIGPAGPAPKEAPPPQTKPSQTKLPRAKPLQASPASPAAASPPASAAAQIAADASIPLPLRQQTKYRIVRLLGRGGMGSVYEVHHDRMNRREALKVINPELVGNPQALARFDQEVQAVARLDHPNICRAYDAESFGALQVIVMEFVTGHPLDEVLKKRGRISPGEACNYVRQACLGLQHAYERGLVHRDLKPQNLMLLQDGTIKILDFGLAKIVSERKQSRGLTMTNMTMGTYEYSAPEQALDAASADIRADIYSLGCTIYYLIAGVLPFNYDSDAKLLLAHQNETPRPLREFCPDVPADLSDLVDCLLAKDPADRPQTPAEVADSLLPFAQEQVVASAAGAKLAALGLVNGAGALPQSSEAQVTRRKSSRGPTTVPRGRQADAARKSQLRGLARAVHGIDELICRLVGEENPLLRGFLWALGPLLLLTAVWFAAATFLRAPAMQAAATPKTETIVPPVPPNGKGAAPPEPSPVSPAKEVAAELEGGVRLPMVLVPAGEILMGSPAADADAQAAEKPQHRVRITRPFYLGTCPVTVRQFRQFVERTDYKTDAENRGRQSAVVPAASKLPSTMLGTWQSPGFSQTDDHPVVHVSWSDAMTFCAWLSRKERKNYRLPTEAEWEYACRAGTTTLYWCGDDPERLAQVANVADATAKAKFPSWKTIRASDGYVYTSPVGKFRANAFGLYDMHGNVNQWCSDWYAADQYFNKTATDDPKGPAAGTVRVVRGSSFLADGPSCRSAYRNYCTPGFHFGYLGFRVACDPAQTPLTDESRATPLYFQLLPIPQRVVEAGKTLTFTATVTNAGTWRGKLRYTLNQNRSFGAAIDPETGVFTYTPSANTQPGMYPITVSVVGLDGRCDKVTVPIVVTGLGGNPQRGPGIDVSMVRPNHFVAIVINPRRIATSPVVAPWLQEEGLTAAIRKFGVDAREVEQLVVFFSATNSQAGNGRLRPVIIAQFTHDVDPKEILGRLQAAGPKGTQPIRELTVYGKTCLDYGAPDVAYARDRNTIVLAPLADMAQMLSSQGPSGPLYERLQKASADNDLIVATEVGLIPNLETRIDAAKKSNPAMENFLDGIRILRGATFELNLTGDSLLQIVLESKYAADAETIEALLRKGIKLFDSGLTVLEQAAPNETKAQFAAAIRAADEALTSAVVTRSGSTVTGVLKRPAGMDKAGPLIDKLVLMVMKRMRGGLPQTTGGELEAALKAKRLEHTTWTVKVVKKVTVTNDNPQLVPRPNGIPRTIHHYYQSMKSVRGTEVVEGELVSYKGNDVTIAEKPKATSSHGGRQNRHDDTDRSGAATAAEKTFKYDRFSAADRKFLDEYRKLEKQHPVKAAND